MTDIQTAAEAIMQADALLIGASNGLSIAEGYHIFADNEMFHRQFGDFRQKYGIRNVLEGSFFPYPSEEDRCEFFRRLILHWITEYRPSQVMKDLVEIIGNKDYFVLTSNADTHLELSGLASDKVFELEGTFADLVRKSPINDKSSEANAFLNRYHGKRLVVLELGVGSRNRMIKLPLMQLVASEPQAIYITLNLTQELYIPNEIAYKSIGLAGDIAVTLNRLKTYLRENS